MTAHDPAPDMVETIGKAIYEGRNGPKCKPWAHQPKSHQEPYLVDAVNALNAARYHDITVRTADGHVAHELRGDPTGIWHMLIDAALQKRERG